MANGGGVSEGGKFMKVMYDTNKGRGDIHILRYPGGSTIGILGIAHFSVPFPSAMVSTLVS